ncbi:hypothetical protein [Serratia fonticola]|uniref:hypothetical protein n=1 Tax=Serratia fonticola TaxID=47917 RepID=UPI001378898C|nr:hypothetical protein [Serratia fonticola]NCG54486.1 hypothetical protein [Serratia fonticola]
MPISSLERHPPVSSVCLLTCQHHQTPSVIREWVVKQSARLRICLTGDITLVIWPYRRNGREYLVCDGFDACQTVTLTFVTGGAPDFDGTQPVVPDMTEALHMIGMLATALDARVKLDCRGEGKALRVREGTA